LLPSDGDRSEVPESADAPLAKPAILFTGEETVDALKKWHLEEYKQVATQPYDLGKFLLGVSSATITLSSTISTLLKDRLTGHAWIGVGAAALFQVAGAVVAFLLVLPRHERVSTEDDIYSQYIRKIERTTTLAWIWGALFLASSFTMALSFLLLRRS
jgi:hypothetical protein